MTDSTEKLVHERTEEEKHIAIQLAEEFPERPISTDREDIRHFFPELKELQGGEWACKAQGVPLVPALIMSPPLVLDLRPLSPPEFERHYGMSIHGMMSLVEKRLLKPSIYVRDPSQWKGMAYLEPLLKKALVKGERSDVFMRRLRVDFDDCVENRRDAVARAFHIAGQSTGITEELNQNPDDLSRSWGSRWAYLDAAAPSAGEVVEELIGEGRLRDAGDFIRVHKCMFVGPITAAVGGTHFLGPEDLESVERVNLGVTQTALQTTFGSRRFIEHTDLHKYLVQRITGMRRIAVLEHVQEERLLEFLINPDYRNVKAEIDTLLETLADLTQEGSTDDRLLDELNSHINEMQKVSDRYRLGAKAAVGAVTGSSAALGLQIESYIGAVAGACLSFFAAEQMPKWVDRCGAAMHKLIHPQQHRVLDFEAKTKSLRDS